VGPNPRNSTAPVPTRTREPISEPPRIPVEPVPTRTRESSAPRTLDKFPCKADDAHQKPGGWEKQSPDSLANADPTFSKDRYKPVLAKAQEIVALLKRATPNPVGVQGGSYRNIAGRSYTANCALKFGATAMYYGMFCMPVIAGDEDSGKVISGGETDTWIYVQVNSLGWLTNEEMGLGRAFPTTNGRFIYYQPRQIGELKGFQLLKGEVRPDQGEEAIIITPDGKSPYKPVTRDEFLRSLRAIHQKRMQTDPRLATSETTEIAKIDGVLLRLSPKELEMQAVIMDPYAHPREMFVPESRSGSKSLVTIDTSFFNPALPRETIQMITVYWYWDRKDSAKDSVIREFKRNFDFAALKQMLGR
jgi:hypothetical protein